jgi:hypothetical protein
MKFSLPIIALLASSVTAFIVPDSSNPTSMHQFEKRIKFNCFFQCKVPRGWCQAGHSVASTFTDGITGQKIDTAAHACTCQRIKDEPKVSEPFFSYDWGFEANFSSSVSRSVGGSADIGKPFFIPCVS